MKIELITNIMEYLAFMQKLKENTPSKNLSLEQVLNILLEAESYEAPAFALTVPYSDTVYLIKPKDYNDGLMNEKGFEVIPLSTSHFNFAFISNPIIGLVYSI